MTELNGNNSNNSSSGRGWIFPANKTTAINEQHDDGGSGASIVSVRIPPIKGEGIIPGKKHHGKLEAIMGPLYFCPTEVLLEFKQPFKIEAAPIIKKKISSLPSATVVKTNKEQKHNILERKQESSTTKNNIPINDQVRLKQIIEEVIAEEEEEDTLQNQKDGSLKPQNSTTLQESHNLAPQGAQDAPGSTKIKKTYPTTFSHSKSIVGAPRALKKREDFIKEQIKSLMKGALV